jgi:putative flippase GtrA
MTIAEVTREQSTTMSGGAGPRANSTSSRFFFEKGPPAPTLEIVVPVYNEEADLEQSVRKLRQYLDDSFPFDAIVTIADNASTDRTWEIASIVSAELDGVRCYRLPEKGRGLALKSVWSASDAAVVAYMDVDLSTGLEALLPLVAPLLSGHSDVAIGSRLAKGARVVRGPKRELISRIYNLIVKGVLHNGFSDAQCGFKAMSSIAAKKLLPLVADGGWFFDTELLVLAERNGMRIHEVPVDWVDDPDSRVDVPATALGDLRGIARLVREFSRGGGLTEPLAGRIAQTNEGGNDLDQQELLRFTGIGLTSTFAYVVLFLLLQRSIGIYAANALVLTGCTAANIAAHARWTFRTRSPAARRTRLLGAAAMLAASVMLTSASLLVAQYLAQGSDLGYAAAVLAGTGGAALIRFVLMKAWIFQRHAVPHRK